MQFRYRFRPVCELMQMTDSYPLKNQSEAAPNNNIAAKWISNVDVFFESLIRVIRGTRSRSSSETQGQSVGSGERAGRKFSSTGERAPGYRLRAISKNSSGCRLLIGRKKCFVLLCPIGEQFLLSSFREFVHDGYCLDHGLSGSCTKEMHAVRKLSV